MQTTPPEISKEELDEFNNEIKKLRGYKKMKIAPINSVKTTSFSGKPHVFSAPFGNEGDLTNGEAYATTCLLTIFPGIDFAKKGFKDATAIEKFGKIAGGVGVTLGFAIPIFAVLKLLNILLGPSKK